MRHPLVALSLAVVVGWGSACSEDSVCGDGIVGAEEACDDGNEIAEDSCTNACVEGLVEGASIANWRAFALPWAVKGGWVGDEARARGGGGGGARLCLFTFLVSSGARARSLALHSAMGSNVGVSSRPSARSIVQPSLVRSVDGRLSNLDKNRSKSSSLSSARSTDRAGSSLERARSSCAMGAARRARWCVTHAHHDH